MVNENTTTPGVNFSLSAATSPTEAIVDCITCKGGKRFSMTVKIVDDFDNPVSGATVMVDVAQNGVPSFAIGSGTTNDNGEVSFRDQRKPFPDACYSTTVTSVLATGLTFDGMEPSNGFAKGTDPTPDADCRSGSTMCGGDPFPSGKLIPASPAKMRAAIAVKRRHEDRLFGLSRAVVGVGVGALNGEPVIEVYLRAGTPEAFARIPARLENPASQ